jgi:DNA-binding MarR family transcriptional regulator
MVNVLDYTGLGSYGCAVSDDLPHAPVSAPDTDRLSDIPIPTLMRAGRGVYAQAIRAELDAIGVDNLPRNGVFALFGSLDTAGPPEQRDALRDQLGISKQAISQLVETLVERGYLSRTGDPHDGRRIVLHVTERGREVIDAVIHAVDSVDEALAGVLSDAELVAFRKALAALAEIKTKRVNLGASKLRPSRSDPRLEPIFPVRDLTTAMAHYQSLGFKTHSFDDGYGFAQRGRLSIHLMVRPGHDPNGNQTAAYLQTDNPDAVHEAWSTPGMGGTTRPVEETPWGMREGSHTDTDGNLIRFGSPLEH